MSRRFFLIVATVITALTLLVPAPTALASNQVVTSCANDTALRTALTTMQSSGGGTLTFNCGTVTILLTSVLPGISTNTIVDGGNKITLSGNNSSRIFSVNGGATLTVQNIVLTNGYSTGDGGAIYNNGGTLLLKHATIQNSTSTASGGAIVTYGQLNVDDSVFANNKGANGGAIYPRYSGAQVSIYNSILHDNQATDATNGWGGAILLWDGAAIAIVNTDLYNNTARQGGAVYNAFANSSMSLQDSKVRDNKALAGNGGGVYFQAGTLTMNTVTLSGNTTTSDGGGLDYVDGANASLVNVTFSGNHANGFGGGIEIANATNVSLTNSTLSNNSAVIGGAIDNFKSAATLTNVTIYGNSASGAGGGISNATLAGRGTTRKNIIVAHSLSGGNCTNGLSPTIISADGNLSDDNSCSSFFNKAHDLNGSSHNPLLGALAFNGGNTQTHLPQSTSPVINAGISNGAPTIDQRGVPRPQGAAYDIGAVEVCTAKPTKPALLTPANNKKAKGPAITLDWNDPTCAEKYNVLVKLGSTGGAKAFKQSNLFVSSVQTKPLTKGQTYYWQVTAVNSAGKTKSDWYKFTVK